MTRGSQILTYGFHLLLLLAIQVFIFLHFSLLEGSALCFVYVAFILMLPYQIPHILLLVLGFLTGFAVDIFYNTSGIHAAATVALSFFRPYVINFLTPRGGYDEDVQISIASLGFRWYISYAAIMIFIHHFILFIIWSLGFNDVFLILVKTVASSVFTLTMVLLLQYLFYSPKKI